MNINREALTGGVCPKCKVGNDPNVYLDPDLPLIGFRVERDHVRMECEVPGCGFKTGYGLLRNLYAQWKVLGK